LFEREIADEARDAIACRAARSIGAGEPVRGAAGGAGDRAFVTAACQSGAAWFTPGCCGRDESGAREPVFHPHADTNTYPHADADRDGHPETNSHRYASANGYGDSQADGHHCAQANGDCCTSTDGNCHSQPCSSCDTGSRRSGGYFAASANDDIHAACRARKGRYQRCGQEQYS
jgi:hypothetical protein